RASREAAVVPGAGAPVAQRDHLARPGDGPAHADLRNVQGGVVVAQATHEAGRGAPGPAEPRRSAGPRTRAPGGVGGPRAARARPGRRPRRRGAGPARVAGGGGGGAVGAGAVLLAVRAPGGPAPAPLASAPVAVPAAPAGAHRGAVRPRESAATGKSARYT